MFQKIIIEDLIIIPSIINLGGNWLENCTAQRKIFACCEGSKGIEDPYANAWSVLQAATQQWDPSITAHLMSVKHKKKSLNRCLFQARDIVLS